MNCAELGWHQTNSRRKKSSTLLLLVVVIRTGNSKGTMSGRNFLIDILMMGNIGNCSRFHLTPYSKVK
jgi:hypothetical protein